MSIEPARDLNGMKRAGHITRLTLDALEAHVDVGVTTAELDAVAATNLLEIRRAFGADVGVRLSGSCSSQRKPRDLPANKPGGDHAAFLFDRPVNQQIERPTRIRRRTDDTEPRSSWSHLDRQRPGRRPPRTFRSLCPHAGPADGRR